MNRNPKRIISLMLIAGMLLIGLFPGVRAAENPPGASGKYLKDIYIAYGKTEKEAAERLAENGWEPLYIRKDPDGEAPAVSDEEAVMVLGIRRTDDDREAVTDLPFVNMKGSPGPAGAGSGPEEGSAFRSEDEREWLAVSISRSPEKGEPILASTLTVTFEEREQPEADEAELKLFSHSDSGSAGYRVCSFKKENNLTVFWETDNGSIPEGGTASVFSAGKIGMIATGGIMVGILGATLVLLPRRRREEELPD